MNANLKQRVLVFDGERLRRTISRMAHEILEHHRGTKDLVFVGIRTRGVDLAQRLGKKIEELEQSQIPVGILDITLYRDDLTLQQDPPLVRKTEIPFDLSNKKVILVDDVLFTGRTVRAALDALLDLGRPSVIQLAVLVDRGHRELPIRADYIGKSLPTALDEHVEVLLSGTDQEEGVWIIKQEPPS